MNLKTDIRPTTFEQLVGVTPDIAALQSRVKAQGVPHTVLLHGPSGCGKTTIARILAGQVEGSVEVIHKNAADLNGVEAARQLAAEAVVRPLSGSKVFILDECQRLSKDAQDVLLIPTEHPPEWCYWFFCTTEPGKISKTLKSRAVDVRVDELTAPTDMVALVTRGLKALKSKLDPKAVAKQLWDGGVRAPRFVLGSVESIHYGGGVITGEEATIAAFDAVRAYYGGKPATTLAYFSEASNADIVSWQYVAANYGASMVKAKNMRALPYLSNILEGYPEEAQLRAAWLVARVAKVGTGA